MRILVGRMAAELDTRRVYRAVNSAAATENPLELEDSVFHSLHAVRERILRDGANFTVLEIFMLLLLVHRLSPPDDPDHLKRQLFVAGFFPALDRAVEALLIQRLALGERVDPFLEAWEVGRVQGPAGQVLRINSPGSLHEARPGMNEAERWPFLCAKFGSETHRKLMRGICSPELRGSDLTLVNGDSDNSLDRLWGYVRVFESGAIALK